uniref:Uncharacterized protein n=1 Tax=Ciona intestinalis TaxID=7719 RepID=H2XQ37_CIOIN
ISRSRPYKNILAFHSSQHTFVNKFEVQAVNKYKLFDIIFLAPNNTGINFYRFSK